jgi:hypothetical protein
MDHGVKENSVRCSLLGSRFFGHAAAALLLVLAQPQAIRSAPPVVLPPVVTTNGEVRVRIQSEAGSNYVLQSSIDLVHWVPAGGRRATSSMVEFTYAGTSGPRRFFRARFAAPGELASPVRITPMVDTNVTASASIGTAGGKVVLTDTAGTRFTLTVPPRALLSPATITLNAITNVAGLPWNGQVVGAVQIRPEGLLMLEPATLDIKADLDLSNGFASAVFGSGGEEFHLTPDAASTNGITAWLGRLDGVCVVSASRSDIRSQLDNTPTSAAARLEQTMAAAMLEARLPGGAPALVTRAEANTALLRFKAEEIAPRLASTAARSSVASLAEANSEVEIVLESVSVYRGGVRIHHEKFPPAQPGDSTGDETQVNESGDSVTLDSVQWAAERATQLAAKSGRHDAGDISEILALMSWVDFQGDEERANALRDLLRPLLNFKLNFKSRIVTDAEEAMFDSTVHSTGLPLQWGGGNDFYGDGTLVYDTFSVSVPNGCPISGVHFEGGVFRIFSLGFVLNFQKVRQPSIYMEMLPPAATEGWTMTCGSVPVSVPNTTMWLASFILAHDSKFFIEDWKIGGGTPFATRDFLGAKFVNGLSIFEDTQFELVHAPQAR